MPFVMCDQCHQPTGMGQTLTRTNPEDGETMEDTLRDIPALAVILKEMVAEPAKTWEER